MTGGSFPGFIRYPMGADMTGILDPHVAALLWFTRAKKLRRAEADSCSEEQRRILESLSLGSLILESPRSTSIMQEVSIPERLYEMLSLEMDSRETLSVMPDKTDGGNLEFAMLR